jgi:hypothetical protein
MPMLDDIGNVKAYGNAAGPGRSAMLVEMLDDASDGIPDFTKRLRQAINNSNAPEATKARWSEALDYADAHPEMRVVDALDYRLARETAWSYREALDTGRRTRGARLLNLYESGSGGPKLSHFLPESFKREMLDAWKLQRQASDQQVVGWVDGAAGEIADGVPAMSYAALNPAAVEFTDNAGGQLVDAKLARRRLTEQRQRAERQALRAEGQAIREDLGIATTNLRLRQDALDEATAEYRAAQERMMLNADRLGTQAAADAQYELELREQAVQALEASRQLLAQGEDQAAQAMDLLGQAMQAEARAAKAGKRVAAFDTSRLNETTLRKAMLDGHVEFGFGRQVSDDVMTAMTEGARKFDPFTGQGLQQFLGYYDSATNWIKGWLTASPGFHSRNYFGAMFNNWLAGADPGSGRRFYNDYAAYRKAVKGNASDPYAAIPAERREAFRRVIDSGAINEGQYFSEILQANTKRQVRVGGRIVNPNRLNPMSSDFAVTVGSREIGGFVETIARGGLAYDVALKGGDIETISSTVFKYHFDYQDLSRAERGVMRRAIPFYTWTRKNFPLQLEKMMQHPEKYLRYEKIRQNVEAYSEEEEVVPSYFKDMWGIRTPFTNGNGERIYAMPDLPYRSLDNSVDPRMMLSSTNPIVKAPVEIIRGRQFFNDIPFRNRDDNVPDVWQRIPGLMPTLAAMGKAKQAPDGWVMKDTDIHLLKQYLPFLNQASRLIPGDDERGQRRLTTTWLSYGLGMGVRTNTAQDQRSELLRREFALNDRIARERSEGAWGALERISRNG